MSLARAVRVPDISLARYSSWEELYRTMALSTLNKVGFVEFIRYFLVFERGQREIQGARGPVTVHGCELGSTHGPNTPVQLSAPTSSNKWNVYNYILAVDVWRLQI